MNARIIDETEVSRVSNPGSDRVVTDVEVAVVDAPDGPAARREAEWHARQEADGEVVSLDYHSTEGPLTDGSYVVRLTVETLRYF